MADPTRLENKDFPHTPPAVTRVEATGHGPHGPTRIDGTTPPAPPATGATVGLTLLPASLHPHFTAEETLGSGGEATVYKCLDNTGYLRKGAYFAIKVYHLPPKFAVTFGTDTYRDQFNPAYAVQILERGPDRIDRRYYDIMEYCAGGTLTQMLARLPGGHARDDHHAREILHAIVTDLNGIQQPDAGRLVHGDLKPDNILVRSDDPLNIVLGDFGLSVELRDRSRRSNTGRGTYAYSAPGALQSHTLSADWWSVGMIMYAVLHGRGYFDPPDGEPYSEKHILEEINTRDIDLSEIAELAHLDDAERARWLLLLCGLLTRDPDLRWGYDQVARWFRGDSPTVYRGITGAAAAESASGGGPRTRASQPYPIDGSANLWTLAETRQWFATADENTVARRMTGRSADKLIKWVRDEFGSAAPSFSLYDAQWTPHQRAAYVRSQLVPEAPIALGGVPLNGRGDLLRLANNAAVDESARKTVVELYDSGLLGALESTERPGFATLEARWRNLVESAEAAVGSVGVHGLERGQRMSIRRTALIAAAGDPEVLAQQIRQRIHANPAAQNRDWFCRLVQGGRA